MDALEAPAPVLAAVDTASSRGAFSTVVHAAASVGGILGRPINRAAMGIARPILRFVGVDLSAGGTAGGQAGQRVADARRAATQGAAAGAGAGMVAVPGPFTFLRSSFFLSLLALSIIVNRIHHLVPPRRPLHSPLSPSLRAFLRLPSLLLLFRAVLLLSFILLDQKGYAPTLWTGARATIKLVGWSTAWAGKSELLRLVDLGVQLKDAEVSRVLWEPFVAVGAAVVTETFVRALADDLASQTSFNLLSFSFLLHIHSSPAVATAPSPTGTGFVTLTPTQLYIHLLLTMLELLTLHLSFAFTPPLPQLRLFITAFYSGIGQVFVLRGLRSLWNMGDGSDDEAANAAWQGTVWLNRAPEMAFEVLAILSIFLRWAAATLRHEPVNQDTVLGHSSHLPRASDDFAVSIIRYGTACIESTRLSGLANEVSPLRILAPAPLSLFSIELPPPAPRAESDAFVQLGRGTEAGQVQWRGDQSRQRGEGGGLGHEIRSIEAGDRDLASGDTLAREPARSNEMMKFFAVTGRIAFYILWRAYHLVLKYLIAPLARRAGYSLNDAAQLNSSWASSGRGNDVDDLADEDWVPSDSEAESSSDDDEDVTRQRDSEQEATDEEDDDDDFDPTSLYRDLNSPVPRRHSSLQSPSSPLASSSSLVTTSSLATDVTADAYAPFLLAHHLTTSASPLTRRRYRALAAGAAPEPPSLAFSSAVEERRLELRRTAESKGLGDDWEQKKRQEWEDGRQRFCVVCTVEERTIVCWPCRCLCLCEDCRENLALRTPAPQHLCPTCRTQVKGFSRIFIP